ncbi:hypothetical protein TNCV_2358441 [Trichonephila clavipes]|nr:hypothetical protein TNCV_2358441 [Trichonephila clavipes]
MDFTEINSRGKRGELLRRIDRQNSRFQTAKTTIIKLGLHGYFVELESAKSALNEASCFLISISSSCSAKSTAMENVAAIHDELASTNEVEWIRGQLDPV